MGSVSNVLSGTDSSSLSALTASASSNANSSSASSTSPAGTDPLANKATFLQLLVAQLKNQDPTKPVDGTTFVTQLAQFSDVEQNLAMRQDMDAVSQRYLGTNTPPSAATNSADPSSISASAVVNSTSGI